MRPTFSITIRGERRAVQIEAIVDSGFDGQLFVPIDVASWIGAAILGWGEVELADGSKTRVPTVICEVELLGKTAVVEAFVTDAAEPIIGTELLDGCRLSVDFDSGKVKLKRKQP